MAVDKPTPPPIPRKGNRPRQHTQELDAAELEEVGGVVDLARTLLKQRIANARDHCGKPYKPHPEQVKFQVRVEIYKMREKGEPTMTHAESAKVEEAMDFILRRANIVIKKKDTDTDTDTDQ
jgi:hypothetical protein